MLLKDTKKKARINGETYYESEELYYKDANSLKISLNFNAILNVQFTKKRNMSVEPREV